MRGDVRREPPRYYCACCQHPVICVHPLGVGLLPTPGCCVRLAGCLLPTPGCCVRLAGACCQHPAVVSGSRGPVANTRLLCNVRLRRIPLLFIRSSVVLISCKLWRSSLLPDVLSDSSVWIRCPVLIDSVLFYVLYLQRIRDLASSHCGSPRVKERYPAHSCEPSSVKEYGTVLLSPVFLRKCFQQISFFRPCCLCHFAVDTDRVLFCSTGLSIPENLRSYQYCTFKDQVLSVSVYRITEDY